MASNHLPTLYQEFIHLSRYSRWLPEKGRRETWGETIDRYFDFFNDHLADMHNYEVKPSLRKKLEEAILECKVMPSMRCLMTAGEALKRENIAGYNCSYVAVDRVQAFDEILYILMNGTGVGFSVERQFVSKLPVVAEEFYPTDTVIQVADSKLGWAKAFKELIALLYSGQIPTWDLSKVRPAGAPLKTFGGRASGPEPLHGLFQFVVEIFKKSAGRKLSSLEAHDIVCKIAEIVVVGGVRRSALISLSNLSDDRMRHAKAGQWWEHEGQRALANNSACYTEKPDIGVFMDEWKALYDSKSGERGIFNRASATEQAQRNGRRDTEGHEYGTNPCSEIILRDREFCNLSEVIVRANDTEDTLKYKVKIATILGTLQSTMTDFRYLRNIWKKNTEEEALLGVSLTGIMDCKLTNGSTAGLDKLLDTLRQVAIDTNKEWAKKLGVNESTAITCVKPSGTVSQLTDSASGIHPRFSDYYLRTVRADKKDPLATAMIEAGFPHEEDIMNSSNWVFSFPQKAPAKAVTVEDMGAMEQLKLWKIYQDHWCEHKPSMTCYYNDDNFFSVCQWIWENFDSVSGISFLPEADHVYKQAPYQKIDKDTYLKLSKDMPKRFNWNIEEKDDNTEAMQTLACVSGVCEI